MGDKPDHMLEIPASLGRDLDRGALPPIEAFMSDDSLQAAQDAQNAGPVHAEDLVPISRAEAAGRTTLNELKVPKTRRVIPQPFQRTRVVGGTHGKRWEFIKASGVLPGDIITGLGLVISSRGTVRYAPAEDYYPEGEVPEHTRGDQIAVGMDYLVTGAGGVAQTYDAQAQVRVFRKPLSYPSLGSAGSNT